MCMRAMCVCVYACTCACVCMRAHVRVCQDKCLIFEHSVNALREGESMNVCVCMCMGECVRVKMRLRSYVAIRVCYRLQICATEGEREKRVPHP